MREATEAAASGRDRLRRPALAPVPSALTVTVGSVLPVFLVGALAVQIRAALSFDNAALGLAVALFFAGATSTVFFGHVAERVGAVPQLRVAALASAAAMAAIALGARSWAELTAALVVAGLANGAVQPASNLLLARAVKGRRQGLAFGIKQAAIPVGVLLASLSVPAVALTVGWRWAFAGGAVLALVASLTVPEVADSAGRRRGGWVPTDATAPAGAGRGRREGPGDLLPLVVLAGAMSLGTAAATALGAFLVTTAVHVGVSKGGAGLLAALGAATGLVARVGTGALADHWGKRNLAVVSALLCGGVAGYALFATGSVWLLVPAVVLAFGAGWGWTGLFVLAVVRTHPEAPARATGITQTGAYVGGMLGPFAFGLLAVGASYRAAWTAAAVVAGLSSLGMLVGRRLLRARVAATSAPAPPRGR